MDIQKEKDAYLGELLERDAITQDEYNDIIFRPSVNAFDSNYLSARFIDNINWGWNSWQAAKAQAVPEGFVLVEKKILLEGVNKIEQLFEDDPLLALGELLPIQQGLKAMIEAQEPTND